ncbi:uncharacterized protein [Dermacentor andersoni]|uniref:uncharacterized protein n=1 Tax=Dermacentor andersoni TaxID=34620 RepID=UPI0024169448|nr:uncharacterized protein LOC129383270 [Dermacentor andersoni]
MPPTAPTRPAGAPTSYQHDLTSAAEGIVTLSAAGPATKFALSVTLKGRYAVPAQKGLLSFLDSCLSNVSVESFGSYAEVCKSPDFSKRLYHSSRLHATQVRHNNGSLVFSYDDRDGLVRKLCTVNAQSQSLKFGIAVFDVDYADFSNACATQRGPFSTLQGLRRVLDYFKTRSTNPASTKECVDQAT